MLGGALFSFPQDALFVLVAVFMVNSAFCAPPFCFLDPVRLFVGLSSVLLMFFVRGCSVFISSGCSVRFVAVFIVKSVPYAPPFCCSVCCFKPSLGRELEGILCIVYRFLMAYFYACFL